MRETREFDVVVIGSGIGGLSAALAARALGMSAILVEKNSQLGGTTCDSYGLIWVGDNHLMRAAGQTDTREDIVNYMTFLGGGELEEARMRSLVDQGPRAMRFYEKAGLAFALVPGVVDHYFGVVKGARGPGRTFEAQLVSGHDLGEWRDKVRTPKDAPYCITAGEQIGWGGINSYSRWDQNLLAERRVKDMRGKGVGLVSRFVKALLAHGVPILTEAPADSLVMDNGRVTGARLRDGRLLHARRGVVIATGGYEHNADLMRDFDPLPGLQPLSPAGQDGDGLIMGAEIGAAIRRIQNNLNLMLGFWLVPDGPDPSPIQCMAGISEMCSPHTIVVNRRGQRFADESYFQSVVPKLRLFDTMSHAPLNLPCYLIFDSQYAANYALAHLPIGAKVPDSVAMAPDLRQLAGKLGVEAEALVATVERFNAFAASGSDLDFHRGDLRWRLATSAGAERRNPSLGAIEKPPYYGLELHPSLGTSSAGLLTDEHARVVHQRRRPIPGLYATGVASARTELGAGYQAGLNMASGMTFGLLAAEHMLREAATG